MIKISSTQKVALDTNIFIYALERNDILGDLALGLLVEIAQKKPAAITSVLALTEVLTRVYREDLMHKLTSYLAVISGNGKVRILDIDQGTALKAAQLRAKYHTLKTPDALILATALVENADIFITADKGIPQKIENLQVCYLS